MIPKSAQWRAATTGIAPGETRDIAFITNNLGVWRVHCHKLLPLTNDTAYWKTKEPGHAILPIGGMYSPTHLVVSPD